MSTKTARSIARTLGLGLLALAAFSTLLFAEVNGKAGTPPKTSRLVVNSSRWHRQSQGKTAIDTLYQATVTHEDTRLTADLMVMKSEGDMHEITCTGNPVFTDPENRITADKIIALSTPRQAEFIGNVKMVTTPKKKIDSKANAKGDLREKLTGDPSTLTCNHLRYNYSAKHANASGNVMIVQKARTVWANDATYDQNLELVTLTGNVHLKNTGEEEMKDLSNAETVTVSLRDDWIDIAAKKGEQLTMDFLVKDDDKPGSTSGAPAPGEKKPQPTNTPVGVTGK